MCLVVPGKIVKIKGDKATVDYTAEKRVGTILEGKYREGDYVIIQGGFIIQKVETKEARQALDLYNKALKEDD